MKKILLSALVIGAISIGANAQLYSANNAAGFGTWTFLDLDGDTYNWSSIDLTSGGSALASQGECIISNSWVSAGGGTVLTPNNLAVSPSFSCATAVSVNLQIKAGSIEATSSGFIEEHYAVYVVTNTTAILAGTYPTPVYEGTLAVGEAMTTQNINITTQAAGQATVYMVIRHFNCTDENFIVIDDILVTGQFASVEENQLEVSVYPNPAVDVLNIKMNTAAASISVYSLDGKLVTNELINSTTATINVADLTPGVYFYEVTTQEGVKSRNTFVKN